MMTTEELVAMRERHQMALAELDRNIELERLRVEVNRTALEFDTLPHQEWEKRSMKQMDFHETISTAQMAIMQQQVAACVRIADALEILVKRGR